MKRSSLFAVWCASFCVFANAQLLHAAPNASREVATSTATQTPQQSTNSLASPNAAKPKIAAAKGAAKVRFTISADKYADELRRASSTLNAWQRGVLPTLPQARNVLPTADERLIRRADGALQTASGAEWNRFLDNIIGASAKTTRLRRGEIQTLREMLAQRLRALENWTNRSSYQPADAQKIVSALASSGEIRTGPTAFQQWWQNLKDSISDFFRNLFKRSNAAATPPKPMNLNQNWVRFFFFSCVVCLLGAIAWYVWRSFGGRFVRRAAREVRFSGEDAELLQLPPDELLSRAAKLAAKGDFAGALRHRYIGLLVTLDERGIWRYDTRRTNWEHIAALKKKARWQILSAPLGDLTRRFDRVRYGNSPCTQTDWTNFDADSAQLETQIAMNSDAKNVAPPISSTRNGASS